MKTNRLSVLCLAGALLLTGVSFISCLKGDDVDTNQYVGGISLNVFGPSPVARGGELRFLGSGMNQVTAVVIPGCADITDINVISDREIRITVPQEAQPGLVTLRTPNGDITTRTELTFTEPISIENFKPATVLPGEELPNLIYSEEDLVVILPSVEAVVNKENAKPGDVIEINGENLDLVRQMLMPDGTEVEFTVTSPTAIEFILPENASDGDVVVVPASGVKVTVAHLTMAVPTNLVATPASGLRGGDEIVLTGLNLDLVTSLSFPGVAENVQPASLSEKELTVVMPEAAQSGSLILNTKSGKQVSIVIETLKPLVGSYNPSSIPAGESLLINGQNLDLVASVTFGGGQTVAVSSSSASQLSVSVPMEAEAGNIVLNMYNGETVEAPSLTVTKPQCCYVMNLPEKVDAGALLELEVANGDKLTQVNVNGSQVQFILRDSKLMISLPAETVGEATLELVSSNGSISYQIEIVGSMGTLIYEGPLATGSWTNSAQISSNMFATAQVGQVITVVVSDLQAGAQGSFKNSSWAAIAPGTEYFNIDGNFSLTITQDILTQLQSGGLIISGKNYTIESVYIK